MKWNNLNHKLMILMKKESNQKNKSSINNRIVKSYQ